MRVIIIQVFAFLIIASNLLFSQTEKLVIEPYVFKNRKGEEVNAERGSFYVPENRSNPNSRQIKLQFVRFKSTNPNPGFPIVYLAGGPGGSGTGTAKGPRFDLFMALRSVADVIAFDQRGTGLSNNDIPNCTAIAEIDPSVPGSREYYIPRLQKAAKTCLDFWKKEGIDINGYTTQESAHDLEDLRKALGVEKIDLWGISYGTHLAFATIKLYEKSINRCVLASVEGLDQTVKRPAYNQEFLDHLNQHLKKEDPSNDILEMMETLFQKLEKNPKMVTYTDQRSKEERTVGISKLDMQLFISFGMLKNPGDSKRLPELLKTLLSDNYSIVAPYLAGLKSYMGGQRLMPLVMDAASGISPKRFKMIEREGQTALLERTTNFPYPDLVQGLGLPDLGKDFRKNPKTDIPTLFLNGDLDGRTYIPAALEITKGFKNHKHIIVEGAGHDLFMSSPEVGEAILQFLQGKNLDKDRIYVKE